MLGPSFTLTYVAAMVVVGVVIFGLVAVLPAVVGRGPGRTWFQRSVISLGAWLVVVSMVTASGLAYLNREVAAIPVVAIGEDVLAEEVEPGEPRNILLVGVDRAEGLDEDDPVNIGRSPNSLLSDTIMILRIDPPAERAFLVSLPRDLWVTIAGTGGKQRINTALPTGGPEMLIRTIEENFAIPIHHYAQLDFAGFQELVALVGGVPMFFPEPVRDERTGLFVNVPPGGACYTLEPDEALAFVRSRAFQVHTGSGWRTDPSGDLGRMSRQQEFVRLAIKRAIERGLRDPRRLDQVLSIAQGNVVLDDALTIGEIVELATQFGSFEPEDLQTYTLPTTVGSVGEASVMFLVESEAQPILDVFRGVNAAIAFLPAIRVAVENGSGIPGHGGDVLAELSALGFSVTGATDAASFDNEQSVIRYAPGEIGAAVILARFLPVDARLEEAGDLGDSTVVLVTGTDLDGLLEEPRPEEEFVHLLPQDAEDVTPTTLPEPTTTVVGEVPEQLQARC